MTGKYNGILKILNEERGINEKVKQLTWNLARVILEEYDGSETFSGSFTAFDNDTYALKITFVDYPKLSLAPKSGDEIYYGTSYPEDNSCCHPLQNAEQRCHAKAYSPRQAVHLFQSL